jgi:hypothetical protein
MIILLNGYVRKSFLSNDLYLFLKKLETVEELNIYIHTWNIAQDFGCWKSREVINAKITESSISRYFRDLFKFVKFIQIDESNVNSIRNDYINTTACSLDSWKRMLEVQNLLINKVSDTDSMIINMSFDLFLNNERNIDTAFNFLKYHYSSSSTILYSNIFSGCINGLDELYIGNFKTMDKLITHFIKNLNKIIIKYKDIGSPEYLLYWENSILDYSVDQLTFNDKKILILNSIKTNLKSDIYKYCCDYIDTEFNLYNFDNIDQNLINLNKKELLLWKTDTVFVNDLFSKTKFEQILILNIENLNNLIKKKNDNLDEYEINDKSNSNEYLYDSYKPLENVVVDVVVEEVKEEEEVVVVEEEVTVEEVKEEEVTVEEVTEKVEEVTVEEDEEDDGEVEVTVDDDKNNEYLYDTYKSPQKLAVQKVKGKLITEKKIEVVEDEIQKVVDELVEELVEEN